MEEKQMFPLKRPHTKETYEDLLEQQKAFHSLLKSNPESILSPSGKVVRTYTNSSTTTDPSLSIPSTSTSPSYFKSESESKSKLPINSKNNEFEFFENPPIDLQVNIKEKISNDIAASILKTIDLTPRPPASTIKVRIDKSIHTKLKNEDLKMTTTTTTTSKKKQSLFARSTIQRQNDLEILKNQNIKMDTSELDDSKISVIPQTSIPIGSDFHPLCTGMTQEDILIEKKKLQDKLDPKLLEFIQKRYEKKMTEQSNTPTQSVPSSSSSGTTKINYDLQQLPINPNSVQHFPHMSKIESEKLEWTMPVVEQNTYDPNVEKIPVQGQEIEGKGGGLNARFNFKGELMPLDKVKTDVTWTQGLHNHGEEMNRPGYTLEELLTLARSVNHHQRTIAFDTLAAIFENTQFGMFDFSLDKSLFYLWTEMDCVYAIRKGLDQMDSGTINSSLNCLAAMLYPIQEEMCLDTSYLWPNTIYPWISTSNYKKKLVGGFPSSTNEKEEDLKDPDICQLDLIEFLITRSSLLTRLDYLMREKSESLIENGTQNILKILIRIARHSPNKIIEYEKLLKYISQNHINSNWSCVGKLQNSLVGVPLSLAIKLFRILSDSSLKNSRIIFSKYNILPSVLSYLAYDQWMEQNHVKGIECLILESFKIWRSFLSYGFGVDEYLSFFPILMKYLHGFHRRDILNSFDLNHATHLFSILIKIINLSTDSHTNWPIVKEGVNFVGFFIIKLFALLSESRTAELCDFDLSLACLEQGLELISSVKKYEKFPSVIKSIPKFLSSLGYTLITCQLQTHSLILVKITTENVEKEKMKYPENFTTCGATIFGGKLNPILKQKTPFSFLATLVRFIKSSASTSEEEGGGGEEEEYKKMIEKLYNSDITKYMKKIIIKLGHTSSYNILMGSNNFFLCYELNFIAEYIQLQQQQPIQIAEFELIYKLIPLIQKCDIYLFNKLLNLCLNNLMEKTVVGVGSIHNNNTTTTCDYLIELLTNYDKNKGKRSTDLIFQKWYGKIISIKHWILKPFQIWYDFYNTLEIESQNIYTNELQNGGVQIILKLINLLLQNEQNNIFSTSEDIVMIYSNITICFLMGYELFLNPSIREVLGSILKKLGENSILKDNEKDVFLISNDEDTFKPSAFEMLYSKLLEEYGASSFGDDVYTGYILLPLRFNEGPNLKIKFINADIIRYVRITEEKSLLPLDYFTGIKETNTNVLDGFITALKGGQVQKERNPLLYKILRFHVLGVK